jgi:MinD-like ATPase involved in chromosome partitioning or flagellar assembly
MSTIEIRQGLPNPVMTMTGQITAVWGCPGSGRSLIATNLAFELATLGERVLLVDLDSYYPALAAYLGLTEPGPGVLAALRLARQSRLDSAELERLSREIQFPGGRLHVLPGLVSPGRWLEFDPEAIDGLIQIAQQSHSHIVFDLASSLEPGILSPESSVSRNQSTIHLVQSAQQVLGVFQADPVGLNHYLWDARRLGREVIPVANRVRSAAVGRNPEGQITRVLKEILGQEVRHFLPEDSAADSMLSKAQPLLICAKGSKLRQQIKELASELIG